MPCSDCGSVLVSLEGCPTCPECRQLRTVPAPDACAILEAGAGRAERLVMAKIAEYDRNDVLAAAFQERERIAREFTFFSVPMDTRLLVAGSALVKRLCKIPGEFQGKRRGDGQLPGLIEEFGKLLIRREHAYDIEAGTYTMFKTKPYDLGDLSLVDLDDFPVYPNERHMQVYDQRSGMGLITESKAGSMQSGRKEGAAPAKLGGKRLATARQTAEVFYDISYMLVEVFYGNPARRKYCMPPRLSETKITPLDIKAFVTSYDYDEGRLTVRGADEFECYARSRFGERYGDFADRFVASDANPDAFPLFLRVGDTILVSQFFGELYCYALLPVLHQKEFDKETERRSKVYELKTVPAHFQRQGYGYKTNCERKGKMEMDGIAVSEAEALVVEAKFWNPRKFLGGTGRIDAFEQTVMGAIDGTKSERKTGTTKRRGVALPDKVKWVDENRHSLGIPDGIPVRGVLAINVRPTAAEYKGCAIEYVDGSGIGPPQEAGP